jgi:hypothetical protein
LSAPDCSFDSGGAVARTGLLGTRVRPALWQHAARSGQQRRPCDSPQCPRQRSFYGLSRKKLARSGPSSSGAFNGNRFPQQKVFQDELPFAGNEWSPANTACDSEIDRHWPCFGFDDLVERFAAWAAEKCRWVRTGRHEQAAPTRPSQLKL